jgi:hypothetical protein
MIVKSIIFFREDVLPSYALVAEAMWRWWLFY